MNPRSDNRYPQALYVGNGSVEPYTEEDWEAIKVDPRGVLLLWEPIRSDCKYVMSMDPTEGITGWTRGTRATGDEKTDNCAIEIFRPNGLAEPVYKVENGKKVLQVDIGNGKPLMRYRDVQVAEWAGPCDAVEGVRIANLLGRIFHGTDEEQCKFIWEAWPGVGLLATQEILKTGYANPWMWQYIDKEAEDTDRPGWRTTPTSKRLLWYRARRHLMNRQALIRSSFLLEEYSNAEIDLTKMTAKAAYGFHDDRFMAANLNLWASHEWAYEEDGPAETVTDSPMALMDLQRYTPGGYDPTGGDSMAEYVPYRERIAQIVDSWDDE